MRRRLDVEMGASGIFKYSPISDGSVGTLAPLGFGEKLLPESLPTIEAARGDIIRLRLDCALSHYHLRISRTAILGRPGRDIR